MKKAMSKNLFREIRNSAGRFISIFLIVAVGSSLFAGVKASCPDMKATADKYFDEQRFMDVQLISTVGFNQNDVDEIRKTDVVKGVMPSYSFDLMINKGDQSYVYKLFSLPCPIPSDSDENYINRPVLKEGRMPEKSGECVIEKNEFISKFFSIGDKIKLSSGTDEKITDKLSSDEFTIVGFADSPYYISLQRDNSGIGSGKVSGFIMIMESDVKMSVYTNVFLTVKNAENENTYNNTYDDVIKPVTDRLESLGKARSDIRYKELVGDAENTLSQKRAEFESQKAKAESGLNDAKNKLDFAAAEIDSGKSKLESAKASFSRQISDSRTKISSARDKLDEGYKQYFTNQAQIESGYNEYNKSRAQYEAAKSAMPAEASQEMLQKLETTKAKLDESKAQLVKAKAQLDAQNRELQNSENQLEATISKTNATFAKEESKLKNAQAELDSGLSEYNANKEKADTELNDAQKKLDDAEKQIGKIPEAKWYVLNRDTNIGYVEYGQAADRMNAIGKVFPVFFFLIAALVCLTTMTRMVDEQRTYIGTVKALGYSKSSIAAKFLLYAAIASSSGSVLGVAAGLFIFPWVIFNAYEILYNLPPVVFTFDYINSLVAVGASVFSTVAATFAACYTELTDVPALLMRPKAPKAGKRILLERIGFIWNRMSFTGKVTARNIFRYKKRFIMTVCGVAGCMALLLSAFGLLDSINAVADKQFGELYHYQLKAGLKGDLSDDALNSTEKYVSSLKGVRETMAMYEKSYNVESDKVHGEDNTCNVFVSQDTEKLQRFVTFRNPYNHEAVPFPDDGVVLTRKIAETLNVKPGDTIYIKSGETKKYEAKVSAITEHYFLHYAYMSPSYYEKVFGQKPSYSAIEIMTDSTERSFEDSLSHSLLDNESISRVDSNSSLIKSFKDMLGSLNYVVLVLIISAGILAFVVLYNLTYINISERRSEIATIKVLGFYNREVSVYVYRENIILTIIGIFCGCFIGAALHRFIIVTAEVDMVMFGRSIGLLSYLYAALLTLFFAAAVNFAMYFKLTDVNMVESLKAVE